MNKWLYRAAGALGAASGTLLLNSGVAHAGATFSTDAEAMRAGVAQFFTAGGAREEVIGGLLGGAGGGPLGAVTGGLNGITGGAGGKSLLGGITGGGDLLGGVAGSVISGSNPVSDLTGGLGGLTDLNRLTGSLTNDGPLKTIVGGAPAKDAGSVGDKPAGGVTGRITGGILGDDRSADRGITTRVTGGILGDDQPADADALVTDLLGRDGTGQATTAAAKPDQRNVLIDPSGARQVDDEMPAPDMSAMIADAVARHMGMASSVAAMARAAQPQEEGLPLVGALPFGVDGLLSSGEGPLGKVLTMDGVGSSIPLIGPALGGDLGTSVLAKAPVVGTLLNTDDAAGLPLVGSLPLIGDALKMLTGAKAEPQAPTTPAKLPPPVNPSTAKPSVGSAPVGSAPVGNAPGAKPPTTDVPGAKPPAAKPAKPPKHRLPSPAVQTPFASMGQTPLASAGQTPLAPAGMLAAPGADDSVAQAPIHAGKHRATERPELTDPDYLESGSPALLGTLTNGGLPVLGSLLEQLSLHGLL